MKNTLSLLFIFSIFLSACSGATPEPTQEASVTQVNIEESPTEEAAVEETSNINVNEANLNGLEITVWIPWFGIESDLFNNLANQFNSDNEWGIKVNVENQVNFSNIYETTTSSLPTANRPDLVISLPEHAQSWYADGFVTELTNYVDDPKYGIDSNDIPFVFWNQDLAGTDRIAIPAQRDAQFLLWNQTWAEELGYKSAPESADDFNKQTCAAHTSMTKDDDPQNDSTGGWLVNTDTQTAYGWMLAFGGGVLEEGNYRFLAPNNIDSFKFLRELSEAGCSYQAANTDPAEVFANRQALFITSDLSQLPSIARAFASADNSDDWVVLPFPGDNNGALAIYGSSYVILDSTDEEQLAAWLFVRWMLDNEQDKRWVETTHLFPVRSSTLDLLSDYERTHPQWAQAVDLLPEGEIQPQLASWRIVKIMLGDGFTHMYRVNVPSGQVAAILAQMESTARDLSK